MSHKILEVGSVLLLTLCCVGFISAGQSTIQPLQETSQGWVETVRPAADNSDLISEDQGAYFMALEEMTSTEEPVSAESVNAIGRKQSVMADQRGMKPPTMAGWSIYLPVPFYSQHGYWDGDPLGFGCPGYTIGSYGCHLTVISMLYAYWGYSSLNPRNLNNWQCGTRAHFAFGDKDCGSDCSTDRKICIRLPEAIGYPCCTYRPWGTISMSQVYSHLQRGHPVVLKIRKYGGEHFVLVHASDGTRFWYKDPWQDSGHQDQPLVETVLSVRVYGYYP